MKVCSAPPGGACIQKMPNRIGAAHAAPSSYGWHVLMRAARARLMFSSDAVTYHYNPSFQFKMIFLTAALLFHFTLYRHVVRHGRSPVAARLAGGFSLVLWTAVLTGGRFIAFI